MSSGDTTPLMPRVDPEALRLAEDLVRTALPLLRRRLMNRSGQELAARFAGTSATVLASVFERLQTRNAAMVEFTIGDDKSVRGLMLIEGSLLSQLVGQMLGGEADPEESTAVRALTPMDLHVARRMGQDLVTSMAEACTIGPPPISIEQVGPGARSTQALPRSATVLEALLDFGPADAPYGLAALVLPVQVAGLMWPSGPRRQPRDGRSSGIDRILPVPIEVRAELTRVQTTLEQLRQLQVGSEIELGAVREARLHVGDRVALVGEAGESDGHRSMRVKRRLPVLVQGG